MRPKVGLERFEEKKNLPTSPALNNSVQLESSIHSQISQTYFKNLLTYLLTPWSRVLLEKLSSKLCS